MTCFCKKHFISVTHNRRDNHTIFSAKLKQNHCSARALALLLFERTNPQTSVSLLFLTAKYFQG